MAETALVPVQFHGATLTASTINGVPYVAMRPICEAIGLQWEAQLKRIRRHPVMAQGVSVMDMPSAGGDQQAVFLPLSMLNGWLFGVSVSRVKPELRERLTQYQAECFDVLARHFGAQPAQAANPALDYTRITPAQAQDLKELVHTIVESGVQGFGETWRRLHNKFRVNSYLELSSARFDEARAYLIGKLPEKHAMPKVITPAMQSLKRRRYLTLVDGTSLPQTSEIGDDQHIFSTAELCSHIENEVLARGDLQAIARAVCNLTLRKAGAEGAHSFERIQA